MRELDLGVSIASSILLDREFRRAMQSADPGQYVEKPKSLDKLKSRRRTAVTQIVAQRNETEKQIIRRTSEILAVCPRLSKLEALDFASKSMLMEADLVNGGAIYGKRPWNFCLTALTFPNETLEAIRQTALEGVRTIATCLPIKMNGFTPTETYINALDLRPNGARVDILLTKDGPRIIEVNINWVDGIQALSTFGAITLDKSRQYPVKLLNEFLAPKRGIAIVNISSGRGSRAAGPQLEMEALAKNLANISRSRNIEVIDPAKVRPEYLINFDAFYLNGDPRMLGTTLIPDWLQTILKRVKNNTARVFPNWNPGYDRKRLLLEASAKSNAFMKTLALSERTAFEGTTFILKGESFSSQKVAFSDSDNFEALFGEACMFPEEYTVQEAAVLKPLAPVLAFDTSSNKPAYITNPNYKFNVWVINNTCAGVLLSVSADRTISDKDYNGVPLPV